MFYRRLFEFPPSWRVSRPYGEWEGMRRQMERWFEDAVRPDRFERAGVFPLINLSEDKDKYYVRAELPGVRAAELELEVTGNNLAISGERRIAAEDESAKYHRREREAGTFSRMIGLPGEVDSDKVEARLENGILTVVVSKAEVARPKQISVS